MVIEVKPYTPSLAVYDVRGAHRLFDNGALLSLYLQTTPYPEVGSRHKPRLPFNCADGIDRMIKGPGYSRTLFLIQVFQQLIYLTDFLQIQQIHFE